MSGRDWLLIAIVAALACIVIAIVIGNWLALASSICWAQAAYGWRCALERGAA